MHAKLKVDGIATLELGDNDEDEESPLKFKREDVAKMHAYRDALPYVRSARVLYPGNVPREFPALDVGAHANDVIGAVPLVPGTTPTDLLRVVALVVH